MFVESQHIKTICLSLESLENIIKRPALRIVGSLAFNSDEMVI